MAVAAAVATGVVMALAKVDNQMVGVLLATLAVAVVLVGQRPTLCLQRIRKVSARVMGC
jgi:membrane protein implicated in regulation of membrane protease activity